MKKLFIILMVATTFFTACNSSAEKKEANAIESTSQATVQPAKEEGEYLSFVDTTKIITYDDFIKLSQKLHNEFVLLSQKKHTQFVNEYQKAYNKFIADVDDEIKNIQVCHPVLYNEWRETEDYGRREEIEKTSPEFTKWRQIKSDGWAESQKVRSDGWEVFQKFKSEGWAEYTQKKSAAWTAYKKHCGC
jgi:hypothetical protein